MAEKINLTKRTVARLKLQGRMGDSFDDVINRVLDDSEEDLEDEDEEEEDE